MGLDLIVYRRAHFTARLPTSLLYTRAHYWIQPQQPLQIGLTPLATRMLGEIIIVEFAVGPGDEVDLGEVIGSIEGVKALSEIYSPAHGSFARANPLLEERPRRINHRPFTDGWLFELNGEADPETVDVDGYVAHLDETIDRLQAVYGDQANVLTEDDHDAVPPQ